MANKLNTNIDIGAELEKDRLRDQALGGNDVSGETADKHKTIKTNNTQKHTGKMLIAAKVLALTAAFASIIYIAVVDGSNIINGINKIPNAYVGALIEFLYIVAFLILVVAIPVKILRLILGLHYIPESRSAEEEVDEEEDIFEDDSLINPASGLPMIDSTVDVGGNIFGSNNANKLVE